LGNGVNQSRVVAPPHNRAFIKEGHADFVGHNLQGWSTTLTQKKVGVIEISLEKGLKVSSEN